MAGQALWNSEACVPQGSSLRVHRFGFTPAKWRGRLCGIAKRVFHRVHRFAVHRFAVHRFAVHLLRSSSLRVHLLAPARAAISQSGHQSKYPAKFLYVFSACIPASIGNCKRGVLLHVAVAPQFGSLGLICFSGTEAEKPAGQRVAMAGNKILYEPRWHQGQSSNAPQPYTFTRSSTVTASLFCLGFSASVER
jgi:hypothetical protein